MKKLLVVLILVVVLLGFSRGEKPPKDFEPPMQFHEANREFGIEIFKKLYEADEDENIFISPISISYALSMVYIGAEGETKKQMARTLKYWDFSVYQLKRSFLQTHMSLEDADEKVEITIANALFGNKNVQFKEEYVQNCEDYYFAELQSLDFASQNAYKTINKWVEDETDGMIDKIINKTKPSDLLYILNAIYFNGQWSKEFNPEKTRTQIFNKIDGSSKDIKMMHRKDDFEYFENEIMQAITLPYGNERFAMNIFLPKRQDGIKLLLNNFDNELWLSWQQAFEKQEGTIILPKFSIEYDKSLKKTLKTMGMEIAFQPGNSNFSKIAKVQSYISDVLHKAVIKVDEKGTEAAAVTAVKMSITSARPPTGFTMKVDHPFLLTINDTQKNEILFMGIVYDPKPLED